jgi:hypothetical protein
VKAPVAKPREPQEATVAEDLGIGAMKEEGRGNRIMATAVARPVNSSSMRGRK